MFIVKYYFNDFLSTMIRLQTNCQQGLISRRSHWSTHHTRERIGLLVSLLSYSASKIGDFSASALVLLGVSFESVEADWSWPQSRPGVLVGVAFWFDVVGTLLVIKLLLPLHPFQRHFEN